MSEIVVDGIGQIGLTVKDLVAAKQFYGELLGLRFLFDAETMAFYQCGELRLMLGTAESAMQSSTGGTILYFRVQELDAVCTRLKAAKVEFVQDAHLVAKMPDHELWMAFIKDPDGDVVGLMEEVR